MNFFRLFKQQNSTITGAAILLGAAALASDAVGLLRDRLLASNFGAGNLLDAYYAAFKVPDLVFNLIIVGALSTAFIPVFTKLRITQKNNDPRAHPAWILANNCIHTLAVLLVVAVAILELFTPALMRVLAPGFGGAKQSLTISLTRIMFLSPVLLSFSSLFGGILQSMRRFLIFALAPIFYNLGIILGILVWYPLMGPVGLAWGVVSGALFHCIIQYTDARHSGYKWFWHLNWRDAHLKRIAYLMVPRTLGVAVSQINILIITSFASLLGAGSVAVFNLAWNLQSFPLGVFGIGFALAAFPVLSAQAGKNDMESFRATFTITARKILFFMIPASLIFLLIRAQIVRVILGSGAFNWNDTVRTADTLAFFTLSLFAQALVPLISRAFFALEDTKTPFFIGVVSEIANIGAAWYFMRIFGVAGLALGATIGSVLNALLLWLALHTRVHTLHENSILKTLIQISVGSLCLALIAQFTKTWLGTHLPLTTFINVFMQGALAALAGIIAYGMVELLLKNEELLDVLTSFKKKILKKSVVSASDISLPS